MRNSPRYLLARQLGNLRTLLVLSIAYLAWIKDLSGWWFSVLIGVLLIIAVGVLVEPFITVFTKELLIEDDTLRLREGVIAPVHRSVPLSAVSVVQVDRPWYLRPFGLNFVTVVAQGAGDGSVVMEALTAEDLQTLQSRLADPGAEPPAAPHSAEEPPRPAEQATSLPTAPAEPEESRATSSGSPVGTPGHTFRASTRDIVATAAGNATVVAVIFVSVLDSVRESGEYLRGWLGLPMSADTVAVVIVALALVATLAITYATFRGLEITCDPDGFCSYRYGWLSRLEQRLAVKDIVAVNVSASVVDLVLGTRRLTVRTAALGDGPSGSLRLPSLREQELRSLLRVLTGRDFSELEAGPGRAVVWTTALAFLAVAVPQVLPLGWPWWGTALLGLLFLVATVWSVRYLTGSSTESRDGGYVVWRNYGLVHSVEFLSPEVVCAEVTRKLPLLPLAHMRIVAVAHRAMDLRHPLWLGTAEARAGRIPAPRPGMATFGGTR